MVVLIRVHSDLVSSVVVSVEMSLVGRVLLVRELVRLLLLLREVMMLPLLEARAVILELLRLVVVHPAPTSPDKSCCSHLQEVQKPRRPPAVPSTLPVK